MKKLRILICFCCIACSVGCGEKADEKHMGWTPEDRKLLVSELNRTTMELEKELQGLSEIQANYTPANGWSIKEVIAHLEMQNQLHFREISVMSKSPSHPEFFVITNGKDDYFTDYATNPVKSTSQWFLEPGGKYASLELAWDAFLKARTELLRFVEETEIDLRYKFTYRVPVDTVALEDLQIGQVRDLHQLLLTGIAHTDRHIHQIRRIKEHPDFPEN